MVTNVNKMAENNRNGNGDSITDRILVYALMGLTVLLPSSYQIIEYIQDKPVQCRQENMQEKPASLELEIEND